MMHARAGLISAVVLMMLVLAGIATDSNAQQRTVTGILESTAGAGHDNPGWRILLEEPAVLGQQVYDSIEVYVPDEDLTPLAGKRVSATGSFVQWRTPARGSFIVLEACELIQVEGPQAVTLP